jgi:hypothetical protein
MTDESYLFFSYSHHDQDARTLPAIINDLGFKTWMDEQSLRNGTYLNNTITAAIEGSKGFVAAMSPNYINNTPANFAAWEFAHARSRGKTIIPIVLDAFSPTQLLVGMSDVLVKQGNPLRDCSNEAEKKLIVAHALHVAGFSIESKWLPPGTQPITEFESVIYPTFLRLQGMAPSEASDLAQRVRSALRANPDSGIVNLNFALLMLHQKRFEEARDHIVRAGSALHDCGELAYFRALIAMARHENGLGRAERSTINSIREQLRVGRQQRFRLSRLNVQWLDLLECILLVDFDSVRGDGEASKKADSILRSMTGDVDPSELWRMIDALRTAAPSSIQNCEQRFKLR